MYISDMKELWKDIKGYEGLYQISNLGRVKSLHQNKEKILKLCKNKYGNKVISFYKDNKRKNLSVHRLVAEHFLDDYNEMLEVCFKDGNKSNCISDNLYMSNKDNSFNPLKKLLKFDIKDYNLEVKNGFIYIKEK